MIKVLYLIIPTNIQVESIKYFIYVIQTIDIFQTEYIQYLCEGMKYA